MIAVIDGKVNDSVEWVRGSDKTFNLILLNDNGTLLDASAASTTVTIKIHLSPLKGGSTASLTAATAVGTGADGEFTFAIADDQTSVADLYVGVSRRIDVELDLAAAGDVVIQNNEISLKVS